MTSNLIDVLQEKKVRKISVLAQIRCTAVQDCFSQVTFGKHGFKIFFFFSSFQSFSLKVKGYCYLNSSHPRRLTRGETSTFAQDMSQKLQLHGSHV